jgi:integration host factor subunit beta
MTRTVLMVLLAQRQPHLFASDVEAAIESLLEQFSDAVARGERITVRGFGSFSLRFRRPHVGHNPRTGTPVAIPGSFALHFRPGRELSARVNGSADAARHFLRTDAKISAAEDAAPRCIGRSP